MIDSDTEPDVVRTPLFADDVQPAALLGICASLKPPVGLDTKSATREILVYTLRSVAEVYPEVFMIDLRDYALPFFDGRLPREYENAHLDLVSRCIRRAGAILLSIPAYWSGVSGAFKNLVDISCGPAYDRRNRGPTVFEGKPVGLFIVGADDPSARSGARQAQSIMRSTGARLIGGPLVLPDPLANEMDADRLSADLLVLGGELAQEARARSGAQ